MQSVAERGTLTAPRPAVRGTGKHGVMAFSSILKKVAMALTGLGMFLFLIGHLAGNLLLLKGPDSFNGYAAFLAKIPLVVPVEIGLLLLALLHIASAVSVTLGNWTARPQRYAVKRTAGSSTFASRTMWIGGLVLAVFIPLHVWMFKYGDHHGPQELYGLVMRSFQNPLIAFGYAFAMIPLGLHLSHGFASAFQTLGINRPRLRPRLRAAGAVLGWLIALGFLVLPFWGFFGQ
ncbi:MAG: succinate dehydrogenase cytochrome b subunit [Armatimonadetes bacterium]|nr:succinate dehydrogenase cytochrome b subunit [Armatimonadota bacterium]